MKADLLMQTCRRFILGAVLVMLAGLGALPAAAQSSAPSNANKERGISLYTSFEGSTNELGQIYRWNTSAGYDFNKYFGFDVGLPVYFINASSSSSSTTTGLTSGTGLGNVYADLRLTFLSPVVNYVSTLTGTAPTGDKSLGLTTGRATYDWNNHFDKRLPLVGITPFVNLGVANTVSDTPFFTRPFTSLGTVGHFEGGAEIRAVPFIHVGASVYAITPTGTQRVFSRVIPGQGGTATTTRRRGGPFETQHETVGGTSLTRDNGASAWIGARLGPAADLEAGYTRSVDYNLNTFSFGIGFNLGYLARKARGH